MKIPTWVWFAAAALAYWLFAKRKAAPYSYSQAAGPAYQYTAPAGPVELGYRSPIGPQEETTPFAADDPVARYLA